MTDSFSERIGRAIETCPRDTIVVVCEKCQSIDTFNGDDPKEVAASLILTRSHHEHGRDLLTPRITVARP